MEPIFDLRDFKVVSGVPKQYSHIPEGSGQEVIVHFCDNCGTKLFLTFQRFPDVVGVYAVTFDDPNWFDLAPENSKYLFLGATQRGTAIPTDVKTFLEHATSIDGTSIPPMVFDTPRTLGKP